MGKIGDDGLMDLLLHNSIEAPPAQLKTSDHQQIAADVEQYLASGGTITTASPGQSGLAESYVLSDGSVYKSDAHRERLRRAGEMGRIARRQRRSTKDEQ
jgi:hypothetical protein